MCLAFTLRVSKWAVCYAKMLTYVQLMIMSTTLLSILTRLSLPNILHSLDETIHFTHLYPAWYDR